MEVGIKGCGVYLPRYRIKYEHFRNAWPNKEYWRNTAIALKVQEKAVPHYDEDSVTMAVEAGRTALKNAQLQASQIGGLILGSACPVYKGNPSSVIVAKALNCHDGVIAVDLDQGSGGGAAALQVAKGLVASGEVKYALAIGSDCVPAEPGSDPLEPIMGAGAGAFILGAGEGIAAIKGSHSFISEAFDIWNEPGERFFKMDLDQFRFNYDRAIITCVTGLMAKMALKPEDYQYVVLQQPSGREPLVAAAKAGFSPEQLEPGMMVSLIGDCFSASALIGLAKVLEQAKPGEKVLLASYGAGCSTAFHLETTAMVAAVRPEITVADYLQDRIYIDYPTYLRFSGLLAEGRPEPEAKPTIIEVLRENEERYRLRAWECIKCGLVRTAAQKICPNCYSQDWRDISASLPQRGRIYMISDQRYTPAAIARENKQDAVLMAIIDLGDERRVSAQIVDHEGRKVEVGAEVEVVFRRYKSSPVKIYGYKFRPVAEGR